jgi:Flp pilus assembly pilin Flp
LADRRRIIVLGSFILLRAIYSFLNRDQGQVLAEYCLIAALIALVALGIFWHVSGGIQGI